MDEMPIRSDDAFDSYGRVGERCGIYHAYLSRLERGQANPTLNAMEVIANGLISVFELWDRVRTMPK